MSKVPVGLEVNIAVVVNIAISRDIAPYNRHVNWRFEGKYHLHLQSKKSAKQETSVLQNVGSHMN
jgi:hypothetical protein